MVWWLQGRGGGELNKKEQRRLRRIRKSPGTYIDREGKLRCYVQDKVCLSEGAARHLERRRTGKKSAYACEACASWHIGGRSEAPVDFVER